GPMRALRANGAGELRGRVHRREAERRWSRLCAALSWSDFRKERRMNERELRADFKAELLARVARTPSPVRRAQARRAIALVSAAVAAGLGIFTWKAGPLPGGRQSALVFGTSSGIAILAVASLWLALDRGGSMLGRSRSRLLVVPLASPLVVVLWR